MIFSVFSSTHSVIPTFTNIGRFFFEPVEKVAKETIRLIACLFSLPYIMLWNFYAQQMTKEADQSITLASTILFWRSNLLAAVYIAVSDYFDCQFHSTFIDACLKYDLPLPETKPKRKLLRESYVPAQDQPSQLEMQEHTCQQRIEKPENKKTLFYSIERPAFKDINFSYSVENILTKFFSLIQEFLYPMERSQIRDILDPTSFLEYLEIDQQEAFLHFRSNFFCFLSLLKKKDNESEKKDIEYLLLLFFFWLTEHKQLKSWIAIWIENLRKKDSCEDKQRPDFILFYKKVQTLSEETHFEECKDATLVFFHRRSLPKKLIPLRQKIIKTITIPTKVITILESELFHPYKNSEQKKWRHSETSDLKSIEDLPPSFTEKDPLFLQVKKKIERSFPELRITPKKLEKILFERSKANLPKEFSYNLCLLTKNNFSYFIMQFLDAYPKKKKRNKEIEEEKKA